MARWQIVIFSLLLPGAASAVTFDLSNYTDWPADGDYGLKLAWTTSIMPAGTTTEFSIANATLTWDPTNLGSGASIQGTLTNNGGTDSWTIDYTLADVTPFGAGFVASNGDGWLTFDENPSISQRLKDWWWGELNPLSFILLQTPGGDWLAEGYMWLPKGQSDKFSKGIFLAEASVVPLPAAVWLFGSALLALFGIRRISNRQSAAH